MDLKECEEKESKIDGQTLREREIERNRERERERGKEPASIQRINNAGLSAALLIHPSPVT